MKDKKELRDAVEVLKSDLVLLMTKRTNAIGHRETREAIEYTKMIKETMYLISEFDEIHTSEELKLSILMDKRIKAYWDNLDEISRC